MEHLNVTAENKKKGLTPAGKYGNLFKVIEKTKQSVHSHRSTKGDYYAVHLFLVYEGAKVVHALMEVQNY